MQFLKHYQGIPLNLAELSRIFKMIGAGISDKKTLLSETGYGDNKVRAIKEYLKDFNLIGDKGILTPLGIIILKQDARFFEPFTRWVLLYNWSLKENNPFLNFLVNDGYGFRESDNLADLFKHWGQRNAVKTDYDGDMVADVMNRTRTGLIETSGFQSLNLFTKGNNWISRSQPYHVESLLIAYVFYHNRKKRTSISFSELAQERDNIALFFDLNHKVLEERVVELNNLGLTRLIQYADLHMVEYCFAGNAEDLIEKYYVEN